MSRAQGIIAAKGTVCGFSACQWCQRPAHVSPPRAVFSVILRVLHSTNCKIFHLRGVVDCQQCRPEAVQEANSKLLPLRGTSRPLAVSCSARRSRVGSGCGRTTGRTCRRGGG